MTAIFLSPVYILINVYVILRSLHWMNACHTFFRSSLFRIVFVVVYVLLSSSVLTGFLIKKPASLHWLLKNISNYFLGTFLYILLVLLIADVLRLVLKYIVHASWIGGKYALPVVGGICFTVIVAVSVYGILNARHLRVKEYEVTVDKTVEDLDSLKIVLIADTHFGYSVGSRQAEKLAETVNAQNPDIVCIAGDIFDNEYDAMDSPEDIKNSLKSIQATYGVYACWGNHDLNEPILAGFTFHNGDNDYEDPRMEQLLKNAGIQLLEDESILVDDKFYVVGRKDASRIKKMADSRLTPAQLTGELDQSKPIIVIDHQPKELDELADAGADLDLCGHTHDGQMFPGNITTSFLWENSCGYLQKGSMHNIVTSGVGVWGPAMRVGTDSEICTITVNFS